MAKTNNTTARKTVAPSLDWNAEVARIESAAKDKAGSRGDHLQRVGKVIAGDTPASLLLRAACGDRGGQAIIDQPRNVLAKLPKLATALASGTAWCSADAIKPENKRKEDASVVVALAPLLAGKDVTERQKGVIAQAMTRYPGGANAQMSASLDACAFMGIVNKTSTGARNAEYSIADAKRAQSLMPTG